MFKKYCFNISIFFLSTYILSILLATTSFPKTFHIAMVLWRGETNAEKGFKAGIKKLSLDVRYTILNANQDKEQLKEILSQLEKNIDQYDCIYSFGTTVSKSVKSLLSSYQKIPQLYNIVTAPYKSKIIQDQYGFGENISGVSNYMSLKKQIDNSLRIIKYRKLGYLYNPEENNSVVLKTSLEDILKKYGIKLIPIPSLPKKNELNKNLQKLINKEIEVDAIFLPSDSFLISNAQFIGNQLKKGKLKSIAFAKEYIKKGALLGTAGDYEELGNMAAMIFKEFTKHNHLKNVPVKQLTQKVKITVNKNTMTELGIKIPKQLNKGIHFIE